MIRTKPPTNRHRGNETDVEIGSIRFGDRMRKPGITTIDKLVEDMAERGLLQRIGVRARADGQHDLIWGRHRVNAAQKLKWEIIPAVVYPEATTDDQALELEIVENLLHKELSSEEKAEHTARLAALLKRQAGESLNDFRVSGAEDRPRPQRRHAEGCRGGQCRSRHGAPPHEEGRRGDRGTGRPGSRQRG